MGYKIESNTETPTGATRVQFIGGDFLEHYCGEFDGYTILKFDSVMRFGIRRLLIGYYPGSGELDFQTKYETRNQHKNKGTLLQTILDECTISLINTPTLTLV